MAPRAGSRPPPDARRWSCWESQSSMTDYEARRCGHPAATLNSYSEYFLPY